MSSSVSTDKFIIEGILLTGLAVIGIIGNILCIATFAKKVVQQNFHRLMLSLAAVDLCFLTLAILIFGLPTLMPSLKETNLFKRSIPFTLPATQISITGSIYMTLAIGLERYLTVVHPFFKISHNWSSRFYILPILAFSVLYNIPKFLEVEIFEKNVFLASNISLEIEGESLSSSNNSINQSNTDEMLDTPTSYNQSEQVLSLEPTSLRKHPLYIQGYIVYANMIVHGLIPLLLLVFLNTASYRQIRRLQKTNAFDGSMSQVQMKDIRLAQVSLIIVAVFIICHSARWIPNIYEAFQSNQQAKWPRWVLFTSHCSHLLIVLNSSVNFYIYTFKQSNKIFRVRHQSVDLEMTQLTPLAKI